MQTQRRALKAAFPHTLPVLAGFTFLGLAYGIYMQSLGFSFLYPMSMSITILAGSGQFVATDLLVLAFAPLQAFLLTLLVNARHLFYGISMLDAYRDIGPKKWYIIFGMCDETFSINCSTIPPPDVDRGWFMFFVTLLDHIYWILGSTLGGVLGAFIPWDMKGIDFAMTAMFVAIFVEQWMGQRRRLPALIGVIASAACLLVFGPKNFILPAMASILLLLTGLRSFLKEEVRP